jgi:glucose-1-phosphate adenylyltransferase
MKDVIAIILAGGKGERLYPLTKHRAKPAVPFVGEYRIIDFSLSNCINSEVRRVFILVQYKSLSLLRHIRDGWQILPARLGEFIDVISPQMRISQKWYQGTADAIYQNLYSLRRNPCGAVVILAGDHVYKMDYRKMLDFHKEHKAVLTVGVINMPKEDSKHFGVMEVDDHNRVLGFYEKPENPAVIPHDEDNIYASMGIYIFDPEVLYKQVTDDSADRQSKHDFGTNIIPNMLEQDLPIYAFPFGDGHVGEQQYWRDVGTLDSFYEASIDMVSVNPLLNLYDPKWPIHTFHGQSPPAKFVHDQNNRRGSAVDSIVSNGCIVSGAAIRSSVLSQDVHVHSYSIIEDSIIFGDVEIGEGCRLRNVIVDRHTTIPPNTMIGFDHVADSSRYTMSEKGVIVVTAEDFQSE